MLPFKNIIKIDPNSKLALYIRISNAIIEQISIGALPPDTRLPSTRALAEILSVHRKTVVAAYNELNAQGWIVSKKASGTYVNHELPILKIKQQSDIPIRKKASKPKEEKFRYSIDDGSPDTRLAPLESFRKSYSSLFRNKNFIKNLGYNRNFKGDLSFRKELALYLKNTRGIYVDAENILVTRGSIHAFYLIVATFLKGDKNIAAGVPGYGTIDGIVQLNGGNNIPIPIDEKGISVDFIEALCKREQIDAILVIPHHHYPTTVTLSPERRIRLVELAKQNDFIIMEDDYDYDFHYEGGPALPLASLNHEDKVVYVGSFSKTVVPAMRLGFIVAEAEMIEKIANYRRFMDRTSDLMLEKVMLELLKFGEISRHNKKAIKIYKQRRDLMHLKFQEYFSDLFDYKVPEGGMAFWIRLKKEVNYDLINQRIQERNIDFGRISFEDEKFYGFRVGFAAVNEKEIEERVELLKYVFQDYL